MKRRTEHACNKKFLSTPSARRATEASGGLSGQHQISIHALREEGDEQKKAHDGDLYQFLSTPSVRRATSRVVAGGSCLVRISIHALREEGDF